MIDMDNVLGVILGGGRGSRLSPLTRDRAKPAVPIAGKYRLIDIPISNCINGNIHRIAVLTQFNSVSLHRHITQTYRFDNFSRGWVQILAAEQTLKSNDWYQGTADAVRKQLGEIKSTGMEHTLILAGDHLYRMNFEQLVAHHSETGADITLAVQPVRKDDSGRFGLLKSDSNGLISDFVEKPTDPEVLKEFVSLDNEERPFLGSMGIYLFKTDVLISLLANSTADDFGKEVIPQAIKTHNVFGYYFDGYWEDIGTIRSFYDTNLSLTQPDSPFNFYDPNDPIYTRPRFLPGSLITSDSVINNVLMAEGCRVNNASVCDSVVGLRSVIGEGAVIKSTVLMGADYYNMYQKSVSSIPLGIGKGCQVENAIIDKNVRMGENVFIKAFPRGIDIDHENWVVRDGIVVIPKRCSIPPDTYIGPDSK